MKYIATIFLFHLCFTVFGHHHTVDALTRFEGRWYITISMDGHNVPSWVEMRHSGIKTLVGHFVGPGGSARPISEIFINGDSMRFSIPPQWEREDQYMTVKGMLANGKLGGQLTFPNGKSYSWSASKAPDLRSDKNVTWDKAYPLILPDVKGWHASGANQWVVDNGILKSEKSGSNLITDEKFNDFKLHIEFRYPAGSNSGIYLRGRYEVQVTDSYGREPLADELGGVYGFLSPTKQVAKPAGEWQTYDITLIGRMVTVVANGVTIINNQEIPGITGGALDSNEGEPGPLMLQGDHGPIEYRNIRISKAK